MSAHDREHELEKVLLETRRDLHRARRENAELRAACIRSMHTVDSMFNDLTRLRRQSAAIRAN